MNKIFLTLLAGILLLASCNSNSTEENSADKKEARVINVSGAFALYPLMVKWGEEYTKINPEVKVNVSGGGAGKGMSDVLAGAVDIAMISREVKQEEIDKGAWSISVAKDAVVGTFNPKNQYAQIILSQGLTQEQIGKIFLSDKAPSWESLIGKKGSTAINVFTRSDAAGAAEMWVKYAGNKKQEDLKGTGVNGDPGLLEAITRDVNAIGYNNIGFAFDPQTKKHLEGIAIVPLDINSNGKIDADENFYSSLDDMIKAVKDGKYPSPPARPLFLTTKGKPTDKAVIDLLNWILTDGQKFVEESGFVQLPADVITQGKISLQ